jgi:hypothetical protein
MLVSVFKNALNIEVYRAVIKTFSTHIPTKALVGKTAADAHEDEWRQADVRYIKPPSGGYIVPPAHGLRTAGHAGVNIFKPDHIIHSELSKFASQFGNYDCEIVQIITYREGNYYNWHQDGSGKGYRKLSFISVLNPPNEYDGGELEIEGIDLPEFAYDPLSIIVFNPALKHRVKPITRGIRHSLVTWFKEKDFPNELL